MIIADLAHVRCSSSSRSARSQQPAPPEVARPIFQLRTLQSPNAIRAVGPPPRRSLFLTHVSLSHTIEDDWGVYCWEKDWDTIRRGWWECFSGVEIKKRGAGASPPL